MTDKLTKTSRKKRAPKGHVLGPEEGIAYNNEQVAKRIKKAVKDKDSLPHIKPKLKGIINSGSIFIGDASFFGDDPQKYPEGIIPDDPCNPFKDWDKFRATADNDVTVNIPGAEREGRGVVIQTYMHSGSYSIDKEICPETGKLLSVKVTFRE